LPLTHAQEAGLAVITAPLEGAILSGRVPITGSAAHPQFQRYELAFGYSPNSADTWFSIQDPATTQIINDVLGNWDTSNLTDGLYTIRLRVYFSERDFLEAVARNVRVQNAQASATPAPTETPAPLPSPTALFTATPTPPVIALPPTPTPRPSPTGVGPIVPGEAVTPGFNLTLIQDAFLAGVRFTLICFALLGAYLALKALVRALLRPRR
jgi:hypothetical protein